MTNTETPQDAPPVTRIALHTTTPDIYRAFAVFSQAAEDQLDPVIGQLVKIRASQLNGCAFCIDMHTHDALAAGEREQRLYTLSAWRGTPFFTDRERAALAITEAVTFIASERVSDNVYEAAARQFDETELAHLLWTIVAINAWNRVGVSTRIAPACHSGDLRR